MAIPRKSFFSLPVIVDTRAQELVVEFSTGSVIVPFALYFDEIPPRVDSDSPTSTSVSLHDRLAHHGSSSPHIPRKTVISLHEAGAKPGQTLHRIKLEGKPGIFTCLWDNTQSIVSTRQVSFHVVMRK